MKYLSRKIVKKRVISIDNKKAIVYNSVIQRKSVERSLHENVGNYD